MGGKKKKGKKPANVRAYKPTHEFATIVLMEETDRGCVLAGGAWIEYELGELLSQFFSLTLMEGDDAADFQKLTNKFLIGNDEREPPLGSGWARATAARLMGLISPYCLQLYNQLRLLRNHFAHCPGPTPLDDEAVAGIRAELAERHLQSIDAWHRSERPDHLHFSLARYTVLWCFDAILSDIDTARSWMQHVPTMLDGVTEMRTSLKRYGVLEYEPLPPPETPWP